MKIQKLTPVCLILAVVLTISAILGFAFSAQALSVENNNNTYGFGQSKTDMTWNMATMSCNLRQKVCP